MIDDKKCRKHYRGVYKHASYTGKTMWRDVIETSDINPGDRFRDARLRW